MTNVAATYADSLYDLALEEKLTDMVLNDMELIKGILKENPDYIRLLSEPSISKQDRVKLLDEAFKDNIEKYSLNFLKILCENGLIKEFYGCEERYRKRFNTDHGIVEAVVTTAKKLDDNQLAQLKNKLEEVSGKNVVIEERVDEKFIAGIRVELDGKLYDGTASGRLHAIKKRVEDIIV